METTFRDRLRWAQPLLLDGATGTELDRRGLDLSAPLWSARSLLSHPEVVKEIHRSYVDAGADVITANTFRTHNRNVRDEFLNGRKMTRLAVAIGREAAGDRAYVLGSIAPLQDCYRPELTLPEDVLLDEHRQMAVNLVDAGVDGILVETQLTIREAVAATRAATETQLPTLVSFVCRMDGKLLSGEALSDAASAVMEFAPAALLVNCVPADVVADLLSVIHQTAPDVPLGAYANTGRYDEETGWSDTIAVNANAYAEFARDWLTSGATIIGGCCGTTPAHIRRLRQLLDE
ncbi:homocysteine S-methyltransferase family protein [Thalassoroseus pseudoceratinae]|uniref:homocysteine S-methyltransferase family protein n=1 Tax=Thalassoroseus pseudoceratinae TaxID=2713176 RepID=UPI00141FCBC2|nr:homocysteine S-methyltransferase family protein [Thalassoroseus pseudoceratinae]